MASNKKDLLHYYTNGVGVLCDKAIYEPTKMSLNYIRQIISKDKFNFMVTKPVTEKNCIM